MMKTTSKLILLATVFMFSCQNEQEETTEKPTDSNEIVEANNPIIVSEVIKTLDTVNYELLNEFSDRKKEIETELNSLSKREANKLYATYFVESEALLDKITNSDMALVLDNRYSSNSTEAMQVSSFVNALEKHQLKYRDIGEGYVEIIPEHDFYYTLFKDYVTDDYLQYLALKKEENKTLYAADAGLMISFEELGDRIIDWENFVFSFPNSDLITEVKQENKVYRNHYLIGLDNTPTHEIHNPENKYIYPENLKEFNRFLVNYPESPTSKLVLLFIGNFGEDNIWELIDAKHKSLFGV